MAWPLSQDYNEAIQSPATSLGDSELRAGQPTTNALGMPMPRSGRSGHSSASAASGTGPMVSSWSGSGPIMRRPRRPSRSW